MDDVIRKGDTVREAPARVPAGCQAFEGRVRGVAPDGWVMVDFGVRSFSFAPHEVVKVKRETEVV